MTPTTRQLATTALAFAFTLIFTHTGFAQGTQGLDTDHFVEPFRDTVFVGGSNDPNNPFPIPIDLDPDGPPWTKHIRAVDALSVPPILAIVETIENVGTEPWFDWHEHILIDLFPIPFPPTWLDVDQILVDGQPIMFSVQGIGTQDLWLDNFSSPVNPGQILEIQKVVDIGPDYFLLYAPELIIEQYPTPEPASLALMGLGGLAVLRRRI